jgi:hypothetical protein
MNTALEKVVAGVVFWLLGSSVLLYAEPMVGCSSECEASVCRVDHWCCDVCWDDVCASEAVRECGATGIACISTSCCGDGTCNLGEPAACPEDCCGDGFCSLVEESVTCPEDCCGDGACGPEEGLVCPRDCS